MRGIKNGRRLFLPVKSFVAPLAFKRGTCQLPTGMHITREHQKWHATHENSTHITRFGSLKHIINAGLVGLDGNVQTGGNKSQLTAAIGCLLKLSHGFMHGFDKSFGNGTAITQGFATHKIIGLDSRGTLIDG